MGTVKITAPDRSGPSPDSGGNDRGGSLCAACDSLVSVPTPTKETLSAWEGARIRPGGGKRYIELVETAWGLAWQWNDSR